MSTFVLVHGAWQAASTWDTVKSKLEIAGHRVLVPTLTGLGQDSRQLSRAIKLDTHIEDVARVLRSEDHEDVTLVGHSYAGMIITGVAEHADRRLSRLIYVDAFIPEDGQSALDLLPEAIGQMFREEAAAEGEGWLLRGGEGHLDLWGLKPGPARDFVRSQLCDFSLRCFEQKIRTPGNAAARLHRTFIAAVAQGYPARSVFEPFGDKARREGWRYHELPTGHQCHVELPEAFVAVLLEQASPDSTPATK